MVSLDCSAAGSDAGVQGYVLQGRARRCAACRAGSEARKKASAWAAGGKERTQTARSKGKVHFIAQRLM